ncbi:energy transducer TonB [Burkholderia sp. Ax-1724]|nr:energy transducer TonB [Burkholderia sp. Ax-1724]
MQISHPLYSVRAPALPGRLNVRATSAVVVAVGIHVVLLAAVLNHRDEPMPLLAEPRTITAELLPPAPMTASAVVQSPPVSHPASPPQRAVPVETAKPKAPPITPRTISKTNHPATPTHEPVTPSPGRLAAAEPAATTAAAATPSPAATPAAAASAPPAPPSSPPDASPGRPTMALDAPQDISHLHCGIAQPPYPELSRKRGESGSVTVKFIVGLTGQPESVELKSSSGHSRLDEAALAAVRDSSCRPYLENGTPRRVPTSVPFVFALND